MPASAELAEKPQLALREAVRESDLLMHCRGAYVVGSTGNAGQDALRRLVVELFQASAARKLLDIQGYHDGSGRDIQRPFNRCITSIQHAAITHTIIAGGRLCQLQSYSHCSGAVFDVQ